MFFTTAKALALMQKTRTYDFVTTTTNRSGNVCTAGSTASDKGKSVFTSSVSCLPNQSNGLTPTIVILEEREHYSWGLLKGATVECLEDGTQILDLE